MQTRKEQTLRGGRWRVLAGILVILTALGSLSPGVTAGEGERRTPWGDPDLRGTWTNTTTIPFERSDVPAERLAPGSETSGEYDPHVSSVGAYNEFWTDAGNPDSGVGDRAVEDTTPRTSLVVDPPDGQLPPLTPAAARYADELEALRRSERPASWVELNPYDRCITRGLPGGMIPGFYNHNYQIFQTPDHVAIFVEMIHEARIIPLDGRPHLEPDVRQWTGNSRGRWEGDTLVVETTGFSDKIREFTGNAQRLPNGDPVGRYQASLGTATLRLVERFTRTGENTIDYRFTVVDPVTFTAPWTVAAPMTKTAGPVFEYACHEGNYAMRNMLQVARSQERVEGFVQ